MHYIAKDQKLELIYEPGKGAWTYHIRIPNTKSIEGKWGEIKVSGFIDDFKIEARNLAPTKGHEKMLSINSTIRKAINKSGGDTVTVTLYLLTPENRIDEKTILETFGDSGVLTTFRKLPEKERTGIISHIISQTTDERQVKTIMKYIDRLRRQKS